MRDFVLYEGENRYNDTFRGFENLMRIKGMYVSGRNNYIYCSRTVQREHVPKDVTKAVVSPKDIVVYNTLRDNFDLAVAFAKKYLGYYISDSRAKDCLAIYYASQGWLYPHSTVNNIPFMLFYLQPAINPYGLLIKKDSELEKSVLKTEDLRLEPLSGKSGNYYNKLLPNSRQYMSLTMMLWWHQFKEDEKGALKESISIQISKDISQNPERHEWQTLIDQKIKIPELKFVKFINAQTTYRNKDLQSYAHQLMLPL